MKLAFLLHIYQPVTQSETVLKKVAEESYLPLIQLIKKRRDFRITLNIPLSLVHQMEKYGYGEWVADVRELVESERIELTGSAAYHPLLTKIPQKFVEKQIVLNELGQGYYFGRRAGFEGEPSVLIKNLNGFFPPEMAVNKDLLNVLEDFNYKWVVVDETALPDMGVRKCGVYALNDLELKVVSRDRDLSNLLSFQRDASIEHFMECFTRHCREAVVALDGELFGHHYVEGIFLFGSLIDKLQKDGVRLLTVSDYIEEVFVHELEKVVESSWGASDEDMKSGELYPMWSSKGNKVHKSQWKLVDAMFRSCRGDDSFEIVDDFENAPIWKDEVLSGLPEKVQNSVKLDLLMSQAAHSDQFWWASNKELITGDVLSNPEMIKKGLEVIGKVADLCKGEFKIKYEELSSEIL